MTVLLLLAETYVNTYAFKELAVIKTTELIHQTDNLLLADIDHSELLDLRGFKNLAGLYCTRLRFIGNRFG
jgi:hypothetical protein